VESGLDSNLFFVWFYCTKYKHKAFWIFHECKQIMVQSKHNIKKTPTKCLTNSAATKSQLNKLDTRTVWCVNHAALTRAKMAPRINERRPKSAQPFMHRANKIPFAAFFWYTYRPASTSTFFTEYMTTILFCCERCVRVDLCAKIHLSIILELGKIPLSASINHMYSYDFGYLVSFVWPQNRLNLAENAKIKMAKRVQSLSTAIFHRF
jgi:hypothetical protein